MPAQSIDGELADLRALSLLRRLTGYEAGADGSLEGPGGPYVNFGSNDYLGFSQLLELREAAKAAIDQYGVGAGASRLTTGTRSAHEELERALAAFKRMEAGLVFSSGYAAAVGTLSALCRAGDVIILDKLCHASLIDGARLSGAHLRVFPHNHMGKLESHLQWAHREHPDGRVVVVTESVFSMDGDVAPLVDIVAIKQRYGALLLVDEAHALGVFGQGGRGLVEALGLAGRVDIALGTLSKALGTVGGFVVASHSVIELLVNRARSFIYSTALPPAAAAISLAALRHLEGAIGDQRRDRLYRSIARLQMALRPVGSAPPVAPGWSAIFPVILGQATVALESAALLRGRGLLAPAIRYPTVPKNAARLRISLTAEHTDEQLERLLDHLIGPAGVA